MTTSKQWWESVKSDENKINQWLIKQYRGEITAVERIMQFGLKFAETERQSKVLHAIAIQEKQHAQWIRELLESRNITPMIENAEKRYWAHTLPGIDSFETGAAIASHAEGMRLERIRAIAGDETAPDDIRNVFQQILKDEEWHERAFRELSTADALEATRTNHEAGMEALGLEI